MKFSRMLSFLLVLCLFTGLASAVAEEEKITLRYAYWGSTYENEAMQSIAAKYEAENPNVDIECIYIPNADYTTKMTAMIASGDEPDIANLFPSDFIGWAEQGRFVNLYEMLENDDRYSVDDFIPNCFFETADGVAGGRSIANELIQLYYNVDLFNELGVDPLPANPDEALTWDEFVDVLCRLTVDANGNNALSEDFDPNQIVTYGFDFAKNNMTWGSFVYQNGGSIRGRQRLQHDRSQNGGRHPKAQRPDQRLSCHSRSSDLLDQQHERHRCAAVQAGGRHLRRNLDQPGPFLHRHQLRRSLPAGHGQ